jgi:hypothetical protein
VRFRLPATVLTGAAVLAGTALAGPASASPVPQSAGPQADGAYNEPYAGYSAHLDGRVPITSMSVTWFEPTALPCDADDNGATEIEFGVATSPEALQDKQVSANASCATDTVYLGQDPVSTAGGTIGEPLAPDDELTGSISLSDGWWQFSIADHTQGWTWQRSMPTAGLSYPLAYIGVVHSGSMRYGSATFTDVTINGQSLATANPAELNVTDVNGWTDRTSPLSGSGFTVTQLIP